MNLYYRKRIKYLLTPLLIISIIFIAYQLIIFSQLSSLEKGVNQILGTHKYQAAFYKPSSDFTFTCINSFEKIDFAKVNDDFCDCEDGTDEPGTNACPNGNFFCTKEEYVPGFKTVISSSKVNDGICDCCDGSDEYLNKALHFRLKDIIQKKIGKYMSPCQNFCPK